MFVTVSNHVLNYFSKQIDIEMRLQSVRLPFAEFQPTVDNHPVIQ